MNIYESAEDYLEAILVVRNRLGYCRSIDVAEELNVTKPSVSVAMKKLKEGEFISIDRAGMITLTEKGNAIATKIYERHLFFKEWFKSIGIPEEMAEENACKIEHDMDEEVFDAIKAYVEAKPSSLKK